MFQRTFGSNRPTRALPSRYANARSPCSMSPEARAQLCLLSRGLFSRRNRTAIPILPSHSLAGASTHSSSSPSVAIPQQQFVRLWLQRFRGAIPRHGVGSEVIVIAHQAKSMHFPSGFLAGFGQRLEEIVSINVIDENVLPSVSPIHNVVNLRPDTEFASCAA